MSAIAPTAERIDLSAIAPQAWKNGAGRTRELAVAPRGATAAAFDWRISIADVDGDAPFSSYAGIDRCIVLLSGAGMRLRERGGAVDRPLVPPPVHPLDHLLDRPLAPFRFSGDASLVATLIDGPCTDFNVMTRRGRWRAVVEVLRVQGDDIVPDADATLLYASAGHWSIDAGNTRLPLAPGQAALWRAPRRTALRVSARDAGAGMIAVALHRDVSR